MQIFLYSPSSIYHLGKKGGKKKSESLVIWQCIKTVHKALLCSALGSSQPPCVLWCHQEWPRFWRPHWVTLAQIKERGRQASAVFINSSNTLHDCAVTLSIDYEILLCQLFNITNCLCVLSVRASSHICVCVRAWRKYSRG